MLVCEDCGEKLEIKGREENKVFVKNHECSEKEYECDYCGKGFDSSPAMYGHQTNCEERLSQSGSAVEA